MWRSTCLYDVERHESTLNHKARGCEHMRTDTATQCSILQSYAVSSNLGQLCRTTTACYAHWRIVSYRARMWVIPCDSVPCRITTRTNAHQQQLAIGSSGMPGYVHASLSMCVYRCIGGGGWISLDPGARSDENTDFAWCSTSFNTAPWYSMVVLASCGSLCTHVHARVPRDPFRHTRTQKTSSKLSQLQLRARASNWAAPR